MVGLSTHAFELPQATPPSVLKVGLDVELARAGGKCKVENSHASPRRSPRRRARPNNNDSYAERENAMQTDKDLAGPNGRSSMADTYGIMYKPSPDNGSYSRAVYIGNLPQDINYPKLLAKVRGGSIISATLCNTTKVKGWGGRMSALVVFLNAESARAYVKFANKHGICFDSQKAVVGLVETPTFPLSLPAKRRIDIGHTRYLIMIKESSELSLERIYHVINAGVNKHRADAMERLWKDKDGNVRISFASINTASMAFWRLSTDSYYDRLRFKFEEDPCGRPLSDLLPLPTGRRASDFVEIKLNYDDDDDPEDENTKEIKPVNPLMGSRVNNLDEIQLDDDDVESSTDDNTVMETETAKESKNTDELKSDVKKNTSDEVQTTNEGETVIDLKTSDEAKAAVIAMVVDDEPVQNEGSKENSNSTTSDTFKNAVPTSTESVPQPQNVSDAENSPVVEDFFMLESVTFSPMIPQSSPSLSNELSSSASAILTAADGGVDSWADDVNEVDEAGTLEPPAELKPVLSSNKLIDIDGEPVHPAINFLSCITEENLLMCEPMGKEEPVSETLMEALVTGFPMEELPVIKVPVVEVPIADMFVKESFTITAPVKWSSAMISPVEAVEKPVVKLPSTNTMIPDKFNLDGTDLDPVLLPRYVFDKVLSEKPRGGLSSSRWANPATKPTAPIVIEAPVAVPTLADTIKSASELLFGPSPTVKQTYAPQPVSLAPANAPKGPRAGVPASRWVNPDQLARIPKTLSVQAVAEPNLKATAPAQISKPIPTGPKSMARNLQNGQSHSRYSSLDLDTSRPRSSLRDFYTAIDLQTAPPKKKPDATVPAAATHDAAQPDTANPKPITPAPAKPTPAATEPVVQIPPRVEAGSEFAADALKSGVAAENRGSRCDCSLTST